MPHGHINMPATFFTDPHNYSACTTSHRHITMPATFFTDPHNYSVHTVPHGHVNTPATFFSDPHNYSACTASHRHIKMPATFFTDPHNYSAYYTSHRLINILYRPTQLQCMYTSHRYANMPAIFFTDPHNYSAYYTSHRYTNILYRPTQLQRMLHVTQIHQHSLQTHTTTVHVPRRIDTSTCQQHSVIKNQVTVSLSLPRSSPCCFHLFIPHPFYMHNLKQRWVFFFSCRFKRCGCISRYC